MDIVTIEPFYFVGLAVRTTNENGQAALDMGTLWKQFLSKNLISQIPNPLDSTLHCLYTDYEQDHTKPYTALLGCKVRSLDHVPEGFVGKTVAGGTYGVFKTAGKLSEGIVYQQWLRIWNTNLNRNYTTDFEVYTTNNPEDEVVAIYIALNDFARTDL